MDPAQLFENFGLIFLASLPGRTTFLLLLLGARGRVAPQLAGALAAFTVQCVISIGLGEALRFLPERAVHGAAGLLFLYFAVAFWRESSREVKLGGGRGGFRSAFLLIFAAELGDVSQLAIASIAARAGSRLAVFASALAALWAIAIGALLGGSVLKRFLDHRVIQRVAAAGFLAVGVYLLVTAVSGFTATGGSPAS